jgi:hypothetical protein
MKQIDHDTMFIRDVIDYILQHEHDDYMEQFSEDPENLAENNHVYAKAVLADIDLSIIEKRLTKLQDMIDLWRDF